jgi:hypothetical protein
VSQPAKQLFIIIFISPYRFTILFTIVYIVYEKNMIFSTTHIRNYLKN